MTSECPFKCRALAVYEAEEDTELSVEENEIVTITEKNDNGWWLAEADDDRVGWLPSTYLEKIDDVDTPIAKNESGQTQVIAVEDQEGSEESVQPKRVWQKMGMRMPMPNFDVAGGKVLGGFKPSALRKGRPTQDNIPPPDERPEQIIPGPQQLRPVGQHKPPTPAKPKFLQKEKESTNSPIELKPTSRLPPVGKPNLKPTSNIESPQQLKQVKKGPRMPGGVRPEGAVKPRPPAGPKPFKDKDKAQNINIQKAEKEKQNKIQIHTEEKEKDKEIKQPEVHIEFKKPKPPKGPKPSKNKATPPASKKPTGIPQHVLPQQPSRASSQTHTPPVRPAPKKIMPKSGTLCHGCKKPFSDDKEINPDSFLLIFRKYFFHKDHFNCSTCQAPMKKGQFDFDAENELFFCSHHVEDDE